MTECKRKFPRTKSPSDKLIPAATAIIKSLARRYSMYLSATALFTREDLEQEGWMVFFDLTRNRRYREQQSAFTTLLHASLVKRFNSVLRYEGARCRNDHQKRVELDEVRGEYAAAPNTSPERAAMLMQALEAFAEVNVRFAQLLVEGPPPAFLAEVRAAARLKHSRAGRSPVDHSLNITRRKIMDFFADNFRPFNLDKLEQLANNHLDSF